MTGLNRRYAMTEKLSLDTFMQGLIKRNPGEPEFHQAVDEVASFIIPYINQHPEYIDAQILERLTEPNRIIIFRVTWEDDEGNIRVNRGYRVQNNNAIGPYKGGIRFHKSVTLGILKFLAFEQTFKNSLTGLPMGGGKGGADFNPKGKSDREVMRFCQAFMTELYKHIGPDTDVPAGDIGVGGREISYMYGQYLRLSNQFTGVLTGKGLSYGGSEIRTEATGYGCTYIMQNALEQHGKSIEGHTAIVSGSGNVAQYTTEKVTQLGGKVLTLSDSSGFVHDPEGFTPEKLEFIKELKNVKRGRISEYTKFNSKATFHAGEKPWGVEGDLVFPCATQNELSLEDAKTLVSNGAIAVSEGANMPTDKAGIDHFLDSDVIFIPSKAANAGGVAVSGLEMTQNSMRIAWTREELDTRLQNIMRNIHEQSVIYGKDDKSKTVNYVKGANIAGFKKVADAMLAYGVV